MSDKRNIYQVCNCENNVFSELWRAVFLAKISNFKDSEDVEVKAFSDIEMKKIAQAPYSDALAPTASNPLLRANELITVAHIPI